MSNLAYGWSYCIKEIKTLLLHCRLAVIMWGCVFCAHSKGFTKVQKALGSDL